MHRINIFGINIDIITINQVVELVVDNINNERQPIQITGANPEVIMRTLDDKKFRDAVNKSSIVNVDGISLVIALKMLGYSDVKRAACPDIFDKLIERADKMGYRIFFLGAQEEVIKKMIRNIKKEYLNLNIVGYHHGYFTEDKENEIAELIKLANPDMLFLGITSPKKELFLNKYLSFLEVPLSMGVGGVFDIKAGLYKRAPKWMQQFGLEWLFRLFQEPKRLIGRQINILRFFFLVFKNYSNIKKLNLITM